jgi:hypothetical protein
MFAYAKESVCDLYALDFSGGGYAQSVLGLIVTVFNLVGSALIQKAIPKIGFWSN